jgi:cell division septation protein DedD
MSANRYSAATAEEKANFSKFAKLLKENAPNLKEESRVLLGEKKAKYIFVIGKNAPYIHSLEVGVTGTEIKNVRLVVSKDTKKSDFYKAIAKIADEVNYGGVVIHFEATEETLAKIFGQVGKLADASEEVVLNPKRTYSDPPTGWPRSKNTIDPVKTEKPAKTAKIVEAPAAEAPAAPVTAKEAAKADMKSA